MAYPSETEHYAINMSTFEPMMAVCLLWPYYHEANFLVNMVVPLTCVGYHMNMFIVRSSLLGKG